MPKIYPELTAERLREVLLYDKETGGFVWKTTRSAHARVGKSTGYIGEVGYVYIRVDKRLYLAHRLAWLYTHSCWPAEQIDHINGVRTDNRIANPREATTGQNQQNRLPNKRNTSGHPGVTTDRRTGKWVAQIMKNRKHIHLGVFDRLDDAIAARVKGKQAHHEFQPTDPKATP